MQKLQFLIRPIEHYIFALALVLSLFAFFSVRAGSVPTRDEVLEKAAEANGNTPSFELMKSTLDEALQALDGAEAGVSNQALAAMHSAFEEPDHLSSSNGRKREDGAVPLEPLSLPYPRFTGTPDFIPVAGVAPAVYLQERAIAAERESISLEPKGPESHFTDKPKGGK